jgi:hypothetical protein
LSLTYPIGPLKGGTLLENREKLFGTKATDYKGSDVKLSSILKKIFTIQPVKFWLITYSVSLIIQYFLGSNVLVINIINTVLFPFSIILLGSMAISIGHSNSFLFRLLYPSAFKVLFVDSSKLAGVLMVIIKLILFYIVWRFTFILGIIGFLLTVSHARNLLK